jgi:hypothetical protein
MTDSEASNTGTKSADPRLLEELDEHIREARAAAEEAVGYDGGPSFVESGAVAHGDDAEHGDAQSEDLDERTDTDSTEDDQTIAPPG